jgi:hypothetical protein
MELETKAEHCDTVQMSETILDTFIVDVTGMWVNSLTVSDANQPQFTDNQRAEKHGTTYCAK